MLIFSGIVKSNVAVPRIDISLLRGGHLELGMFDDAAMVIMPRRISG